MKIRKILPLLYMIWLFVSVSASASVTIAPIELTLAQPNGHTFKAKARGNINDHWMETLDGKKIGKVGEQWFYWRLNQQNKPYLSSSAVGSLSTKALAQVPNSQQYPKIKVITKPAVKQITHSKRLPSGEILYNNIDIGSSQKTNRNGEAFSQNVLVVLVSFANQSFKYTPASFQQLMFGEDGVGPYFQAISYDRFTLVPANDSQGAVDDGVVAVTLSINHPDNAWGSGEMVAQAFAAADPFIDYARFDSNNDKQVSASELSIVLIAAGYERSYGGDDASSPSVWGHKAVYGEIEFDGVNLSPFTMFGERHGTNSGGEHQATIGIMAHELGHLMLDLPDLYDTDHSSAGIGRWGLMGGGSWNSRPNTHSGSAPASMLGWSKMTSGFIEPSTIYSDQSLSLTPLNNSAELSKVWLDGYRLNEYLLLENRTKTGVDVGLPGKGLLITHIDPSRYGNRDDERRLVDIEAADGSMDFGDSGDTFPGAQKITQFTGGTNPSTNDNSGKYTGVAITAISESINGQIDIGNIAVVSGGGDNLGYNEGRNTLGFMGFEGSEGIWSALNVHNTTAYEQIQGFDVFMGASGSVNFYLYDTITGGVLGTQLHSQSGFKGEEGWNRFMLSQPQTLSSDNSVVMVLQIKLDVLVFPISYNYGDSTPSGRSFVTAELAQGFYEISSDYGDLNQHVLVGHDEPDVLQQQVDFETGDFSQADFELLGDNDWSVATTNAATGSYSAQSATPLSIGQSSVLNLTIDTVAGNLSFSYAVNAHKADSGLDFYIDDVKLGRWTDNVEWSQVNYAVKAGRHQLRWVYSESRALGAVGGAFIDDIFIPIGEAAIDTDEDGIADETDNCPAVANADQLNTDGADDGGNACDADDDNDGIADEADAFPLDKSESVDSDSDGVGDNADTDDDNDGMPDVWEVANGLDPFASSDASGDLDADGFTNLAEYNAGSDPTLKDSIPGSVDGWLQFILKRSKADAQQDNSAIKGKIEVLPGFEYQYRAEKGDVGAMPPCSPLPDSSL